MVHLEGTRPSAIAGTWYPGSVARLRSTVEGFLKGVPAQRLEGELVGLIVPHAGYTYSGAVAAYAYAQAQGQPFETVVIFSPLHRGYYPHAGAIANSAAAYATPLGAVPVDQKLLQALSDRTALGFVREDDEHALEIQLPFLQVVLGSFDLVPIMVVDQSLEFCRRLGEAVGELLQAGGRRALLVASTDLSHFHSYEQAEKLDQRVLDTIAAYDVDGLDRALSHGTTEACGGGPVMATLVAGQVLGAHAARILHHANSGDVTGDRGRVVGYAAGAILRA